MNKASKTKLINKSEKCLLSEDEDYVNYIEYRIQKLERYIGSKVRKNILKILKSSLNN
jgi:hypothetical protein